ncbi:GYDIA family GHMP kinase [Robertkochia aurantiaca]|uniref:GYDIA family GHMP kinase n=1 Tax=Robertkochia aurantiaca TaxID=2873700 RepID=UPI001CCC6CB8|nr:GYDIA family GHMP kinase [Robertkochia sp. 3YJGBD-33]
MSGSFHSNGKLLLTGEYLILDGAQGLAVPTSRGQSLEVKETQSALLQWYSLDEEQNLWFEASIALDEFHRLFRNSGSEMKALNADVISENRHIQTNDNAKTLRLLQLLFSARELNQNFLSAEGYVIKTRLQFPKDWGLGTSSTLVNNLAAWSKTDPYVLLQKTFGGSGYDIACAGTNTPIIYRINSGGPEITPCAFKPPFIDDLYFIYLNKKQNSREGISRYQQQKKQLSAAVDQVNRLTREAVSASTLDDFKLIMTEHETLVGKIIGIQPVQQRLFSDYNGSIKSLGAWGGDFILAAGDSNTPVYFIGKGYDTVIPYKQMVHPESL